MLVYRICNSIYAKTLSASGRENRWNSEGKYVLYCASSLSLACLEMIVHTSGELLYTQNYSSVTIEIPENSLITSIDNTSLLMDWKLLDKRRHTQNIGDEWYNKQETLLLKVPSAIISREANYLINTKHPDFSKVSIVEIDSFMFDERISKSKDE